LTILYAYWAVDGICCHRSVTRCRRFAAHISELQSSPVPSPSFPAGVTQYVLQHSGAGSPRLSWKTGRQSSLT